MSDTPSKFTLRPLRYVEPGSDSPWKEVFGTQEDGTHRPQYYSQLELPKILETLSKYTLTWLSPELSLVLARLAVWLKTSAPSESAVQPLQRLMVQSAQDSELSAQTSMYLVALFFIFLDSEGKVLARAALKLYTGLDASGNVVSPFKLEHFKGAASKSQVSSSSALELTRLLDSSSKTLCSCRLFSLPFKLATPEVLDSSKLSVSKPLSAGTACQALVDVFYLGYGVGFYGLDPYGE